MTIAPPDAGPPATPPNPPQPSPTANLQREWRLAGVIFFGLLALAVLWGAALIIWPFMTAILLAIILVTLTYPTFRRVRTHTRGKSHVAAVIMLIGITLVLVIPAVILSMLLVQQANTVIENLQSPETVKTLRSIDVTKYLSPIQRIAPNFDPRSLSPEKLLLPAIQRVPGWVARNGGAVVGGLAGAVLGFFLVLLAAFFFYVQGEEIVRELALLSPLPQRYDDEFANKFKDVVDATFRGQILTALAQGFATGVGLAIAGVPGSIFWGAVAAIFSLIPMVGAGLVWVPAAIYLFISASMGSRPLWQSIFMVVWGVLVVSVVDNIVRPWAMKGKAQLPAIPLLFAILGGLQAFGFVGLVIGPLIFSLLMTIIGIYRRTFSDESVEIASG